jgi:hypothetical protein
LFKVRGKNTLSDGFTYLTDGPETAAIKFGCGTYVIGVHRTVYVNKFALSLRLEDVAQEKLWRERLDAQLLACFAVQRVTDILAIVHVAAYGRVPLAGLYILPQRTLLEIQTAIGIKDMEMHYGMEQFAAAMTLAACGLSNDVTSLVDEGEGFLVVVLHCVSVFLGETSPRT